MDHPTETALFREVQRTRQLWVWLLVALVAIGSWLNFIWQVVLGNSLGDEPVPVALIWIFWLLFGIGFPVFVALIHLSIEVLGDGIRIRFFPFLSKKIAAEEIESFNTRRYRPLREYGGWGIRWMPRYGSAYTMYGNQGVQLELSNGKKLLLGSQRPDEMAQALESIKPEAASRAHV